MVAVLHFQRLGEVCGRMRGLHFFRESRLQPWRESDNSEMNWEDFECLGSSWKLYKDEKPLCKRCPAATEPHFLAHVLRGQESDAGASSSRPQQPIAPDSLWVVEYQPGRLARGCQPRPSDVSYLCQPRGLQQLELPVSFLPPKFQGFSLAHYVVQDRMVCIWMTEDERDYHEVSSCSCEFDGQRVCFCVVDLLAQTWRELPYLEFIFEEYKRSRKDWTVELVVGDGGFSFSVALICPRVDPTGVQRRVTTIHTFSSESETGEWQLTELKGKYEAPGDEKEDGLKWPQCAFTGDFLYYASASIDDMLKVKVETGEIVGYCGKTSREIRDEWEGPCRLVGSKLGVFCAAEYDRSFMKRKRSHSTQDSEESEESEESEQSDDSETLHSRGKEVEVHQNHVQDEALNGVGKKVEVETQQPDFGIWQLDPVKERSWRKVSLLPRDMKALLLQTPQNPSLTVHRGERWRDSYNRKLSENRVLLLDKATVEGTDMHLTISVGDRSDDYDGQRLWRNIVVFHIPDASWEVLCQGIPCHIYSNELHLFTPSCGDLASQPSLK